MQLLVVVFRTLFFYFFIVLCYRIMGKREIGQLGVIDLIVSILIAEMIAISIENNKDPLILTLIPIIILVGLEVGLAYMALKSRHVRKFMGGKPSTIILNGKLNFKEMVKQRYSLDDLLLQLRQNNIKSIEDVEYAFLETNGKLSVFKYGAFKIDSSLPLPIIIEGKIQSNTLLHLHKSEMWLKEKLKKDNINLENIFYAFYKLNRLYVIKYNDLI